MHCAVLYLVYDIATDMLATSKNESFQGCNFSFTLGSYRSALAVLGLSTRIPGRKCFLAAVDGKYHVLYRKYQCSNTTYQVQLTKTLKIYLGTNKVSSKSTYELIQ